jgi:hypothetical protein
MKASVPASVGDRNFFRPSSSSNPSDCPTIPKHSNSDFSSRVCEPSDLYSASCVVDSFAKNRAWVGALCKNRAPPIGVGRQSAPRSQSVGSHLCPEAAGNTVCWDGGMGTSPLRSRQRMEFKTWLLASSAWRQFIAADAFAPAAVGALAL